MEGNSCSSICFDAVNVKNEPEYGFNEQVHIKEEVVECLKEEAAWDDSAGAGKAAALAGAAASKAAALASLYAGHEVKDELVLGPECLQPRDVAFTLYAAQASAVNKQHKLRDCAVRLDRIDAPAPLSTQRIHHGTKQENNVLVTAGAQRGGRGETRGRGGIREHGHCCETCNKTFTRPSHLKRHERTHTGERPYSCGTCNNTFTALNVLKRHERTHMGERPYSCGTCNKKFSEMGNLKRHERTHTGERPYSCGTCNKKFAGLGNLKTHELTHTEEKPFSCRTCNKKFTQSFHLNEHERIHTGKKPYTCDVCKKQFRHLMSFKSHKDRIHANWKSFCCDICQKRFAQKTTLVGHIRRHMAAKPR